MNISAERSPSFYQKVYRRFNEDISNQKLATNKNGVDFAYYRISDQFEDILSRIERSTLSDLLLKKGESLSKLHPDADFPGARLVVGEAAVKGLSVIHWRWGGKEVPISQEDEAGPPKVTGERLRTDINIWFGQDEIRVAERITMRDSAQKSGEMPIVSSGLAGLPGTSGCFNVPDLNSRPFDNEGEALFFISIAREIVDLRLTGKCTPPASNQY